MTVKEKLNGKKKFIAGGIGGAISLPFLISFLMNMNTTVVATETQVKNNTEVISELKKLPERMTAVEVGQSDLRGDFTDFRGEQRIANGRMFEKLDRLLAK